jgi:hypothetical protein
MFNAKEVVSAKEVVNAKEVCRKTRGTQEGGKGSWR